MTVQVTTIEGFSDTIVKRADGYNVDDGKLSLYSGAKTASNLIATYAPGFWMAVTKLADPETPDADV